MQSRTHSLAETSLNVASGFIVSFVVWELVVKPVWLIETSIAENLQITALFTILSIARGYVWRRLWNRWGRRTAQEAR
jgi:hypothetical protein